MSHNLGRIEPDGRTFDETTGLDLVLGGPRFVILHFDSVNLTGAAKLTVDLGYGNDVFSAGSGSSLWSRPANTREPDGVTLRPISIRIAGGSGSARLLEYGSGEPTVTDVPGDHCDNTTNPDPFLHTNPYVEPMYESRLECNPGFAWRNAACALPSIPTVVKDRVAAATGIIVMVHDGHVSSCSGTLIGADLFLTGRHCLSDPDGLEILSGSVTFDYATACDGTKPGGYAPRFFKVSNEVLAGSSSDWVIVRLDAAPGALPPPLEMRDATLMAGEVIFTMHHPHGAVKKTQAGVHGGGFLIRDFDYAGGSSGSALFDVDGRLVRGPLSTGGFCEISVPCSVSYVPIAPIKEAMTDPPAPDVPLNVMIVFDRSGSMGSSAPPVGRTKLEEAQDAAALFVQLVREEQGDRIGLVTFSSLASLDRPLGPVAIEKPILVGPSPFTTGEIGAITAGGSTSIGAGVAAALLASGSGSPNDFAVLLLSDGLQNTAPMIEEVEGFLGSTKLCVVGFGSDAEINGPLLSRIAREHGDFTRAVDGLALRKFFGLCFGNIFESGALGDPELLLRANQEESEPHEFSVCGEERITLVVGWDDPLTPLRAHIRTPSGNLINNDFVEEVRGRTWAFWRIPVPHEGQRDGTWTFTVDRMQGDDDVGPALSDVRYFFLVVSAGGPKLTYLGGSRRIYTGDPIDPLVGLHYPNRTTPKAEVELTIEAPTVALGQLVLDAGISPPEVSVDAVDAFHATLQAIQREAGGELPVPTSTVRVKLFDDGSHDDGAMEADGVYNHRLEDLTRAEGTYQFRAVATYGEGCRATREALWSVHVEPGIDSDRSDVTLIDITDHPDGSHGTLVIVPRDRYDNPLGPGRGDRFSVSPLPGIEIDNGVLDRGDGSYGASITWDEGITPVPGVLVHQPDRDPVVMLPDGGPVSPDKRCPTWLCWLLGVTVIILLILLILLLV